MELETRPKDKEEQAHSNNVQIYNEENGMTNEKNKKTNQKETLKLEP